MPYEIQSDKVSKKRRFDQRDLDMIGEQVIDEWATRKRERATREKHWADIDRQIAMEPETAYKMLPDGKPDIRKRWMAELELPLQAQCLEVNTADARRLLFADGPWFAAHSEVTDEYLTRIDFASIILGDEAEVPSKIDQDNADKLVEGFIAWLHRQYDFVTRWDRINAEAFKYGMGVGRARMETKNVYIHEAKGGVRKVEQKLPVIVPVSIKNLYLDTPMPSMHSAQVLGPAHIAEDWMRLENLILAANKGSREPDDADGGWIPEGFKGIVPEDGYVHVLEMEGDIIVPRKTTRSMVIPGAIVTVVVGGKDGGGAVTRGVVRLRFNKDPYSSYLLVPYHYEGANDAYPTSPLEKGRPVQIMATDAANRMLDSAMLKIAPPVGYDRTDMEFAQKGGPRIAPYETWGTTDPVTVHADIGGDPNAMAGAFNIALKLYGELTGVLPARLGAQSVSHTTAYSKDAELQRGAVRTVDYVKATGQGPLTRWLYMAYDMGKRAFRKSQKISFYIDAYGGYVQITPDQLPDKATFEWFGSGGPSEEAQKTQRKLQALQLALQMDQLNVQMGGQPSVDIGAAVRETLREGGWTDIDVITKQGSAVPQQGQANPGAVSVALQQLGLAGSGQQ
jgi:hypothetical protein